jgi:hypothetical protein
MNPTTILPQDEDISLWISQMSQRLEKLEQQRWQPNQQNHTDDTSRSSVVVVIIPTVPTTTKEENETNPSTKQQQQQQTVDGHDYYNYNCDGINRARAAAERLCCYSAQWIWVPSNYYQLSLQQRAQLLGLSSTVHLCKSLLLETTGKKTKIITRNNHPTMDTTTRSHDNNNNHNKWKTKQFVLVILQYDSTLTVGSLSVSLQRQLEKQQQKQQDETKSSSSLLIYSDDWRLASAEDNARLTGYGHNAISPLGMIMESEVIVVISSEIVSFQTQNISPFVVLGGGHEHVKLRISIHELCHATKAIVAPVSLPRNQGELIED